MQHHDDLLKAMQKGDKKSLARCITVVENELEGYDQLLSALQFKKKIPLIGITGPPGAGKSTLINAVISKLVKQSKKIGVIAIDPTSPFNYGSLLGDRIRMSEHFTSEQVYIRSIATRGSLGGLSTKTIEISDVMRNFDFDYIFIETVGVGQSEVEIAGLADITILVLVPEAGDEVQTLKSGIMEIADVFVVNKSDREGADLFVKNLITLVQSKHFDLPVIKTVASKGEGVDELIASIDKQSRTENSNKQLSLLTEKAFRIIQNEKMKSILRQDLSALLAEASKEKNFNLYSFCQKFS